MLETAAIASASDTEQTPQVENQSAEENEQQESFLARMRSGIAQELKFAFTLPRPGKGLTRDLMMKGGGYFGMAVGAYMGEQANEGNIYQLAGETPQSLHHTEHILEGTGGMIAILGAASVLLANRIRSQQVKDDAAFQERLKNDRLSR